MQISRQGQVIDHGGSVVTKLGPASWCLVLHTNDVRIEVPTTEQPKQQPDLVVVPRRPENIFTMLADTVQGELELCFALRGLPVDDKDLSEICSSLGLTPFLDLNPIDLSGGQKAKLAIALALLVKPTVLVIDNSLEPIDQQARLDVIRTLSRAVTGGLRLVELATVGQSTTGHVNEVIVASADNLKRLDGTQLQEVECWGSADFSGMPEPPTASAMQTLTLSGLRFQYGTFFGLSFIDLNVCMGEVVWLTGPNGAGKSTLLKCMALLLEPSAGSMELRNGDQRKKIAFPVGKPKPKLHSHLLYQFQEPDDQIYCASVRDELLATSRHTGRKLCMPLEEVSQILGLTNNLENSPWDLARSVRRLVTLGSVMCANPNIALLDEPTAELDGNEKRRVAWMVREYTRRGGTCIVVSHDAQFMRNVCSRTLQLENGILLQ